MERNNVKQVKEEGAPLLNDRVQFLPMPSTEADCLPQNFFQNVTAACTVKGCEPVRASYSQLNWRAGYS